MFGMIVRLFLKGYIQVQRQNSPTQNVFDVQFLLHCLKSKYILCYFIYASIHPSIHLICFYYFHYFYFFIAEKCKFGHFGLHEVLLLFDCTERANIKFHLE